MIDRLADDRIRRWPARILFGLIFLIGALALAWGSGLLLPPKPAEILTHRVTALWIGAAFVITSVWALWLQREAEAPLVAAMHELAKRVDDLAGAARGRELVLASVLGLFLEVLLIRWHGTELRAVAYFKNVTLLASFLGLGLGFAAANRRRLTLLTTPIALAAQVVLLSLMDARGADDVLRLPSAKEWLWGVGTAAWNYSVQSQGWETLRAQWPFWLQVAGFYGFFGALFVSTILIFVPIGQLTGRLMQGFAPIRAYTLNILGSLAGVVLFGLVSYLWLPPVAWFGLAGVLLMWLLRHERLGALAAGLGLVATLVATGLEGGGQTLNVYSPYQRLEVIREQVVNDQRKRLDTGVLVSANKAYHLRTVNLADDFVAAHGDRFPRLRQMAAAYNLPYEVVQSPPSVLVVGAGGGNDVAAALRHGVSRVDAVEIDPAILELGRRHHAEQPYADRRVDVYVNDARAFMRGAPSKRYDLVVFGLLDSHTLLSGMSAVRLDNFVYTLESLREARRLLKDDGVLALSFATGGGGYLTTRLSRMIEQVFESTPRAVELDYDNGMMFLARNPAGGSTALSLPAGLAEQTITLVPGVEPATDDWPFLYLQGRGWHEIPRSYFVMVGILALISIVWVLAGSGRKTGISPHFFFLGGAFLLIEVKGITELALIYGTTWIVSSVVIAAILVLILLANLFVTKFPAQNPRFHYGLLAACLLAGYFVKLDWLLRYGWWAAAVSATLLLVLPLFFAGVIFATSLRGETDLPRVFASNLLGAILGGLCEYSAMMLGFRNLYLLGLGLYALSFLTMPRRGQVGLRPEDGKAETAGLAAGQPLTATAGDRA